MYNDIAVQKKYHRRLGVYICEYETDIGKKVE